MDIVSRRFAIKAWVLTPGFSLLGFEDLRAQWKEIERKSGGRLGCALVDTESGERVEHRGAERFPLCSTFKFLACALVLRRVEGGVEKLDRRIKFTDADLISYSPATKLHVGGDGMTVAEICAAAMTLSDNTAANLLLGSFGGPAAVTAFARTIGDTMTRLDRTEPDLNNVRPGDIRDTTTPAAMARNLQKLVLGNVVSAESQAMLREWLIENQTGGERLRAGLPNNWVVGDKTGTGDSGITNDIAVIWRSGRAPLILTAYLTDAKRSSEQRNALIAEVATAARVHLGY